MPTIYRVYCQRCVGGPEGEAGAAGYVAVDGRAHGFVTQGWYRAVLGRDGREVLLRHPNESSDLASAGYTMLGASLRGRLRMVEQVLCRRCGHLAEQRTITFFSAGLGCLLMLLLPLATTRLPLRLSPLAAALVGPLSVPAVWLLLWGFVRLAYARQQRALRLGPCERCHADDWLKVTDAENQALPCPECQRPTLCVRVAGIS